MTINRIFCIFMIKVEPMYRVNLNNGFSFCSGIKYLITGVHLKEKMFDHRLPKFWWSHCNLNNINCLSMLFRLLLSRKNMMTSTWLP